MKNDNWKAYYYIRPSFFVHIKLCEDLLASAQNLYKALQQRVIKIEIGGKFPLLDACYGSHSDGLPCHHEIAVAGTLDNPFKIRSTTMTHQRINPPTLFDSAPFGFTQVVKSRGDATVYCAGQTSWDKNGQLVGAGDFAAQCREALQNVGRALAAAGASPKDVVHLRLYVVNYTPDYLPTIGQVLADFFGSDHLPANTLLGVACLALPEFMIEIEATAVIAA